LSKFSKRATGVVKAGVKAIKYFSSIKKRETSTFLKLKEEDNESEKNNSNKIRSY
jgi:hypothetical protein